MNHRLVPAGLAVVAVLAALAGAGGFASLVLLAAIVAGAAQLLVAVGWAADGVADRFPVAISAGALVSLVAAAATHTPLLALGTVACFGLEVLGELELGSEVPPLEPAEAPASRPA